MTGRLIEGQTGVSLLLNQQKFTVAHDNGSDSDIRFPDHGESSIGKSVILTSEFG
jgi:hypothetical protein